MKQHGHIKVSRKVFDLLEGDPFWHEKREFSKWEAWVDLIQLAQWKPRRHAGLTLGRGEFVASVRYLGTRWQWSVKKVWTFLADLKTRKQIAARNGNGEGNRAGTVYVIVNYDVYQGREVREETEQETPRKRETPQEQAVKQEKQNNTYPDGFERAFAAMPKRAGGHPKKTAYRAWSASLKRGADPHAIEDGARRYALFIAAINRTGSEYVKMAATFFGPDDLWLDAWDVPLTVSRGKPEPNLTDPTQPNYAAVEDGVPNDAFLRLIGSAR